MTQKTRSDFAPKPIDYPGVTPAEHPRSSSWISRSAHGSYLIRSRFDTDNFSNHLACERSHLSNMGAIYFGDAVVQNLISWARQDWPVRFFSSIWVSFFQELLRVRLSLIFQCSDCAAVTRIGPRVPINEAIQISNSDVSILPRLLLLSEPNFPWAAPACRPAIEVR